MSGATTLYEDDKIISSQSTTDVTLMFVFKLKLSFYIGTRHGVVITVSVGAQVVAYQK